MSNFYNSEPPTGGKVILKTSAGDFDIELWPKEAPKATRNFVQLCLEGYYDECIFFRVLENFIAQTGDPTNTGSGGESVYGEPFKDEFHSRLRFIHRGLVACANENRPHTNGSQFFITLDSSPQLDRKNTIFGTITGQSIYNLSHLSELETDGDDRPKHPPVITGAEVIWNPFEDIVPRTTPEEKRAAAAAKRAAELAAAKQERGQRRAQKALLSFGEEEEGSDAEDDGAPATDHAPAAVRQAGASMRSAHDIISDARLLRDDTEEARAQEAREAAVDVERRRAQTAVRDALSRKKVDQPEQEPQPPAAGTGEDDHLEDFSARMRSAAVAKRKAMEPSPLAEAKRRAVSPSGADKPVNGAASGSEEDDDDDQDDESEGEERMGLAAQHRERALASLDTRPAAIRPSTQASAQDTSLMTEYQKRIAALKQQKKLTASSQDDVRQKLAAFKEKLYARQAAAAKQALQPGAAAGHEADQNTKAAAGKGRNEEAYAGKVREDIDHEMLKPAAWRADNYLEGDDEADQADIASLVQGGVRFAKIPAANDHMARTEHVDDYSVYDPKARGAPQEQQARPQGHWRDNRQGQDRGRGQEPAPRDPPTIAITKIMIAAGRRVEGVGMTMVEGLGGSGAEQRVG
ncbi:hypothetical protein WJX73_003220 [Symbiochloris irregularis]|uniref:PPIase cyclophilin-type domain-containing protein n=1 Tax=Symbiochloris irregularis TaxID=706552 RepID=A0AAW1PZD4_9CHLO